jgi:hypothetical protein
MNALARSVIHNAAPSETRWKQRSETFAGIAQAMAEQWAGAVELTSAAA